jgi:hypothetical protein
MMIMSLTPAIAMTFDAGIGIVIANIQEERA